MQLQFQALYPKYKHFLNLENTTFKFKYFQGFQAPVRTLYIALHVLQHNKNIRALIITSEYNRETKCVFFLKHEYLC